jgi:hypothetical protein
VAAGMMEFSRTSNEGLGVTDASVGPPRQRDGLDLELGRRMDLEPRRQHAVVPRDPPHGPARSEIGQVAWIVCAMGLGLLLCSVADALSRATLAAPSIIFWVGILLIVVPPFLRLTSAASESRERLVLVCLLGLALFGVKYLQNPFLFTYTDELAHQYNAQQIVHHHHLFSSNPVLGITAKYPGLEGAASALIELTGMSTFAAGLLLIAVARLVLMIGLFLLFNRISGSPRVAGIGAAIYTANSNFLFFAAQFSYESLALPLLVGVLALVAERSAQSRERASEWSCPIVLGVAAVVVTHHVTSYALTVTLASLAVLYAVMRTPENNPWPFALLAALLTAIWLLIVASVTVGYLTPVFGHAFNATLHTIAGESQPRRLFSGAGRSASPIERSVALASVALLVAGLPFGLWQVWRRYRSRPFAWVMSAGAVALFATFPLRYAPAAWETAERAAEFLFLGLAFVLACLPMEFRTPRAPPWLGRAVLTTCFAAVSVGGIVSGWPASTRLSQPIHIVAGGKPIESERLALADWTATHLPGQKFIANETDARALVDYGDASTALNGFSPADFDDVIRSPRLATWELDIIRHYRVSYVVSDREFSPTLSFSLRGASANLVPESAISKLEAAPAARVFDSGQIIVYDTGNRP